MLPNVIKTEATCQNPTRFDRYGMPADSCGARADVHRPDRMFVRFLCAKCADKTSEEL